MPDIAVDDFLDAMTHARMADVLALREILLSLDGELVESIKWNAPSYGFGKDHRLTMRLLPGDRVDLILHRGAAARTDDFTFEDFTGMVRWLAHDRGIIEFADSSLLNDCKDSLRALGRAWLAATKG